MRRTLAVALLVALIVGSCGWTDDPDDDSVDDIPDAPLPGEATDTAEADPSRCGGIWPSDVTGRPSQLGESAPDGFYVWRDKFGFRLESRGFAGEPIDIRLVGSRAPTGVTAEPEDAVTVLQDANRVGIGFVAVDEPRTVRFGACDVRELRIEIDRGGGPWPADNIFVGREGTAVANPLVFERQIAG